MNKKLSYFLLIFPIALSVAIGSYVWLKDDRNFLQDDKTIGGYSFPEGSYFEVDSLGDIILELDGDSNIAGGVFPDQSRFYFDGNQLKKIDVKEAFSIGEIEFDQRAQIDTNHPHFSHQFKVIKEKVIDGMSIKKGCQLRFVKNVLHSVKCPDTEVLKFKRFIELPEAN